MAIKLNTQRNSENPSSRAYPASPFRLFEDFFNDWAVKTAQSRNSDGWRPAIDVLERDGNIVLRAEVPGLSEKDVDLKLEGAVLTIRGERKAEPETEGITYHQVESYFGSFSRSFTLPDSADVERINASCKNGVLTITVPQNPEVKSRSIRINT
jgi:HSP20 family protein